jgi:hypothetical protein
MPEGTGNDSKLATELIFRLQNALTPGLENPFFTKKMRTNQRCKKRSGTAFVSSGRFSRRGKRNGAGTDSAPFCRSRNQALNELLLSLELTETGLTLAALPLSTSVLAIMS